MTVEKLNEIKFQAQRSMNKVRSESVLIGVGLDTGGIAAGAQAVMDAIVDELRIISDSTNPAEGAAVQGAAVQGAAVQGAAVQGAAAESVTVRGRHHANIQVVRRGSIGMSRLDPIVDVWIPGEEKVTYVKMTPERARRVIREHIIRGNVVSEYILHTANDVILSDYALIDE